MGSNRRDTDLGSGSARRGSGIPALQGREDVNIVNEMREGAQPNSEHVGTLAKAVNSDRWNGEKILRVMDEQFRQLGEGQKALRADVSVLKQDVSVLKQDVSDLKQGQDALRTELNERFEDFATRILNGVKAQLETHAVGRSEAERRDYQS
jgi:hypothetical protein